MDEKEMSFDIEPEQESAEPSAEQPAYAPTEQPAYFAPAGEPTVTEPSVPPVYTAPEQPVYFTPAPEPAGTEPSAPPVYAASVPPAYTYSPPAKKEKKDRSSAKMVLLIVLVAILGSVGGVLLKAAVDQLNPEKEEAAVSMEESQVPAPGQDEESVSQTPVEETKEAEETPYERQEHSLPENLAFNDTGKSLTPAQVYELTVNSVVGIQTEATMNAFGQEAVSASAGSGFILSEDGYIITNCHVVAGADKITVDLFNGDSFPAQLVGSDSSFDIAVLKIEAAGLPAVSVGDSDDLKVGEEVVAIGNPLGELTFTMTNGILSALDREINTDGNPQNMLQTNAAINSGNSGGPLFDMDGNVIGVTTAKYSGSTSSGTTIEGLGFAIPINDALKVAYDLVDYGYVKGQAYLGVTVATLDAQTAAYYGLPVGPRVDQVTPGSCAETGGIQVGDIILSCNGVKVESNPELLAQLKKHKAGETITLDIFRAGAELQVTVTLDEKPSQEVLDQAIAEQQQQQQQQQEQYPGGYYYQFPDGFDFFD